MPSPADPDQSPEYEQLLQYCEQLREQVESLTLENIALRGQCEAAESETERLTAIIDAEAEDLQQFGSNWFKPSAVVSITLHKDTEILINGSPIGWGTPGQEDTRSVQMQEIAMEVNRQNAEKRNRARRK